MRVTRVRAFALLTIALLWAITPAMACVLPGATMTPAERECCHHMAEQCGSSVMPASHSCCKAQGPTNTVLPQAQAAGPVRPLTIAVLPPHGGAVRKLRDAGQSLLLQGPGTDEHCSSPGAGCRSGSSPHNCCDTTSRIVRRVARGNSAIPSFVSSCPTSRTVSWL